LVQKGDRAKRPRHDPDKRVERMGQTLNNLEQVLDHIARAAGDRDAVSMGTIVEAVGRRSFGPLLLMAGVVMTSPLSGIPGMSTSMAVLVLSIAFQLLVGRDHFWLPGWLLQRSVSRKKLNRALDFLKRPARFIDRHLRPRLTILVHNAGAYVIAVLCIAIAAGMPIMELVPFSATAAGVALSAFGLALVARDGALALFAVAWTGITFHLVAAYLL
jgi:hypothetical protein